MLDSGQGGIARACCPQLLLGTGTAGGTLQRTGPQTDRGMWPCPGKTREVMLEPVTKEAQTSLSLPSWT